MIKYNFDNVDFIAINNNDYLSALKNILSVY